MPLTAKTYEGVFKELTTGEISPERRKAINTIAKRKHMSFDEARHYQAGVIAANFPKKK
jgi:hypothetical protein